MEMDMLAPQQVLVEIYEQSLDVAAQNGVRANDVRANDVDTARSEENILQWMSYLPEDCVRTMIAMGWDVTT
jgi:hypothetical protein